ncbi:MAG TPA: DUF378 domain-containing protein [Candidatus Saccharimonadales bacterium]|nr:DUF378 domain-containing protein [Candidatus Saccharimonadales bacterium]
MNMLDKATYTLLVIGGLNWALIGFFNYNLVSKVFSTDLARIIYSVVGVAALYGLFTIVKMKSQTQK